MGRWEQKALILGGSGLVGYQVVRKLIDSQQSKHVVIAALTHGETLQTLRKLREDYPEVTFEGYSGNLFLPGDPVQVKEGGSEPPLPDRRDKSLRQQLFEDIYRDFQGAYKHSHLAKLVRTTRPDVIVDCVNTATGISYQDVFTASQAVRASLDQGEAERSLERDVENLLISMSIPQLILHSRILTKAMTDCETRLYLKIGTTGTGGMGLNIPYTHGEERPSPQLLNKTAIAFAQTGMLFLMGRTPGGPVIKEVKPAALIGYRGVEFREAKGRQYKRNDHGDRVDYTLGPGQEAYIRYRPLKVALGEELDLTPDARAYEPIPDTNGDTTLRVPLVDTGENGLFTRGEFEAITSLDQMEYITPEEIADIVVMEVRGIGTGKDVISAIDSAVLSSTYKAGLLRPSAIEKLKQLESAHEVPSIALGRLGPPDLAKHLFEAHLFQEVFGGLAAILKKGDAPKGAEQMSQDLHQFVEGNPELLSYATSIGIPVLCADGKHLYRGPFITAPTYRNFRRTVAINETTLEEYAATWVDLRPARVRWWLETFAKLKESQIAYEREDWSTSRVTRHSYMADDIEIGSIVAWIFGTQDQGFRVL